MDVLSEDEMDVLPDGASVSPTVVKGSRKRPTTVDDNGAGSSSQSVISQTEKNSRSRLYPDGSTGPWVVYFQPKQKPLNVVQIASDLTKRFSAVTEITSVRHNKLRVVVSSLKQANDIAVSQHFTLEYRVYIPARDVEIEGVVTEASLTPEIVVKEAGFTPTASLRVTFSGSALPHYIELGKLRLPVRLFVPRVMNCQNCKQLGHTASHCSNKARCSTCGEKHEDGACTETAPKCVYCKEAPPHALLSCPVYKQRGEKLKRSLKERSRRSFADMVKASKLKSEFFPEQAF